MCALRRVAAVAAVCLVGVAVAGCKTLDGAPPRLYSTPEEVAHTREIVLPSIVATYNSAASDLDRMAARNDYIWRRMYIIDLEYTDYETALTRERQIFGFSTALTAQALTTAGTVFTPINTVHALNGLATGINTSRGFYDSELLVSKTVQIVEGQMQAQRDRVATRIISRINKDESTRTYPLSAALHDLEEYYRAGTLSEGLIKAVTEAGNAAKNANDVKQEVMLEAGVFEANDPTAVQIRAFLSAASGDARVSRVKALNACLPPPFDSFITIMAGANFKQLRRDVLACAKARV